MSSGAVGSLDRRVTLAAPGRSTSDQAVRALRALIVLMFAVVAIYYVRCSLRWQMTVDSPIMHYVNFLMDHGLKPYSDITDNNMPGAYYTEGWAMHVFGGGDLAWRLYDFFLTAVLTGALIVISWPYDWIAGLFASGLFLTVHAAEGTNYSVEREQVILVLLAVGFAAMFTATRRQIPLLTGILGIACGLAVSIKPTFLPLPLALIALMAVVLHRRKISWLPYVGWAAAGLVVVAALDVEFLLQHHAVEGFLFVLRTITPAYASLQRFGVFHLMSRVLPQYLPLLVLLTVAAGVVRLGSHGAWTWEQWALALGVVFGLLSFFIQGKGFEHHRYTYLVFLFLLMGIELFAALRVDGWPRWLAVAGLLFLMLFVTPYYMRELHRRMPGQAVMANAMEADLEKLGGATALQDKVQCFDMVDGCLNALYHLRIVENTGFTGDMLLFTKEQTVATRYYRGLYWDLVRKDPPAVLIVSNMVLLQPNSFNKVQNWPQFEQYLQQNFTQVLQRSYSPNDDAYRIYIRKGDPLLEKAEALRGEGVF